MYSLYFKPNFNFRLLIAKNQPPHHSTSDVTTPPHTRQYSVSVKGCAKGGTILELLFKNTSVISAMVFPFKFQLQLVFL